MKNTKDSSQTPTLSDLIEIIRDPQLPTTSEYSFPTEAGESDPIYMLGQLVVQLERVLNNERNDESENEESEKAQSSIKLQHNSQRTPSEIERYIELFQKQSAVLRRVMSKLH